MTFDSFGIYFHIGNFILPLRYYGIILVTGAFMGGYLASIEARRRGQDPERVWDAIIWALIGGILGARLWHVLTPPPSMVALDGKDTLYYFAHPIEIFKIWEGGLGIPGAVAGGLLALYIYTRLTKLNFPQWADIATPGIALGQAIGRWGNFVNQELYGAPTRLPWGLQLTDPRPRLPQYDYATTRFHPLFLYESIGNLLICLALLYIARRYAQRLKNGDLFLIYLMLYPALRFVLEFIRLDSSLVLGVNANQALMAVLAVLAAAWLARRHRRVRRYEMRAGPA